MSHLAALMGVLLLAMSPAWAQTPPAAPGSPRAGKAPAAGGIMDYWWVILLVVIIAVALRYFSHRSSRV